MLMRNPVTVISTTTAISILEGLLTYATVNQVTHGSIIVSLHHRVKEYDAEANAIEIFLYWQLRGSYFDRETA